MTRYAFISLFTAALLFGAHAAAHADDDMDMENEKTVVLRTIDKVSARTHTFEIPVDKTVKFGNSLFIKTRACRKASPLDKPESAAFLQIWERKPSEKESHWLFSGWMFSSSPSLSYLDHPVYDVWVIDCKNAATSKSAEEFSADAGPAQAPETQGLAPAPKPAGDTAAAPEHPSYPVPETVKALPPITPVPDGGEGKAGSPPAAAPQGSAPPAVGPPAGFFDEGEDDSAGDGDAN